MALTKKHQLEYKIENIFKKQAMFSKISLFLRFYHRENTQVMY